MQDDRSEMESMKELDPTTWALYKLNGLNAGIQEYNEIAEKNGLDVIVAFTMTIEEREEFLNGQSEKASDKEQDNS